MEEILLLKMGEDEVVLIAPGQRYPIATPLIYQSADTPANHIFPPYRGSLHAVITLPPNSLVNIVIQSVPPLPNLITYRLIIGELNGFSNNTSL